MIVSKIRSIMAFGYPVDNQTFMTKTCFDLHVYQERPT